MERSLLDLSGNFESVAVQEWKARGAAAALAADMGVPLVDARAIDGVRCRGYPDIHCTLTYPLENQRPERAVDVLPTALTVRSRASATVIAVASGTR